jgi:NAD(P)-dependent dehydrogenase (short-subunit alcohol dehydrogenase family)
MRPAGAHRVLVTANSASGETPMGWVDQFSLTNRVAVVTGAAGGLGRELVAILTDAGARVVLADTDESKLNELSEKIDSTGVNVLAQVCDVTRKPDILRLIRNAHDKFGSIDVLINCAGILGLDSFLLAVTEQDWDAILNVNLKGTWMTATEVSRYMVEHAIEGSIINISSSLGFRSQLKRVPYAASKAAVEHLTRNMAMELVQYKIRVNCLAPGWMNTDMVKNILDGPEGSRWRNAIPMRRAAEPAELTGALLLLASKASSYMTGTVIRVDGGYSYCGIELAD